MAVLKQCKSKGCKSSPRCEHPWWFDLMHRRKRYRMPVDAFALARGATQPVTSKQEAEKVWEPRFIGEIVAGFHVEGNALVVVFHFVGAGGDDLALLRLLLGRIGDDDPSNSLFAFFEALNYDAVV